MIRLCFILTFFIFQQRKNAAVSSDDVVSYETLRTTAENILHMMSTTIEGMHQVRFLFLATCTITSYNNYPNRFLILLLTNLLLDIDVYFDVDIAFYVDIYFARDTGFDVDVCVDVDLYVDIDFDLYVDFV